MVAMVEGNLRIRVPNGVRWFKADDSTTHGLTHCMKSVDFVVEEDDRIFFIECKDPEDPRATPERRSEFVEKLQSGSLDDILKAKYRDSFLYEWASGRANKPVFYLVLIAVSTLSRADLIQRTDALKRCLPVRGPRDQPWARPFVSGCAVMNIEAWNSSFPDLEISRLPG